jgi:hypothetical protein
MQIVHLANKAIALAKRRVIAARIYGFVKLPNHKSPKRKYFCANRGIK